MYLPLVSNNYPLYLEYGPRGTAGYDSYGAIKPDAWYYWNSTLPDILDPSLARMVKCLTPAWYYSPTKVSEITRAAQSDFQHNIRNRVWLMMNEPDLQGYYYECGVPTWNVSNSVISTTYYYTLVYNLIKMYDPYAKVYAGGVALLPTSQTRDWWASFLTKLSASNELTKVDGVHVHAYPGASLSCGTDCRRETAQMLNDWYQTQHVEKGLGDRPIWITEIGGIAYCPGYTLWSPERLATVRDYVMKPMAWWFNHDPNWTSTFPDVPTNPGYDSMEWFLPYSSDTITETPKFWCTFLETSTVTSNLTILGDFWRSYNFTTVP
jgi:hypothetical protein